jgi:hypothetical protein
MFAVYKRYTEGKVDLELYSYSDYPLLANETINTFCQKYKDLKTSWEVIFYNHSSNIVNKCWLN